MYIKIKHLAKFIDNTIIILSIILTFGIYKSTSLFIQLGKT